MKSTMMDFSITLDHLIERAGRLFGEQEIVNRMPDKSLHRHSYQDFYCRTKLLAEALQKAGLKKGDRVATLMWNHYAHLDLCYPPPGHRGVLTQPPPRPTRFSSRAGERQGHDKVARPGAANPRL